MYGIHVKFNDEHIPNSPFMVNIAPDSGIARTVTVHALKDRGLAVCNIFFIFLFCSLWPFHFHFDMMYAEKNR